MFSGALPAKIVIFESYASLWKGITQKKCINYTTYMYIKRRNRKKSIFNSVEVESYIFFVASPCGLGLERGTNHVETSSENMETSVEIPILSIFLALQAPFQWKKCNLSVPKRVLAALEDDFDHQQPLIRANLDQPATLQHAAHFSKGWFNILKATLHFIITL